MQQHNYIFKWMLTAWIMLWGCTLSSAFASSQTTNSASWGYAPLYRTASVHSTSSQSYVSSYGSSVTSRASADNPYIPSGKLKNPNYRFRSTSVYLSGTGNGSFTPLADDPSSGVASLPKKAKKSDPWDEWGEDTPGGNEVGVVDDPAPLGEPFILLAMALAFILYKKYERKDA